MSRSQLMLIGATVLLGVTGFFCLVSGQPLEFIPGVSDESGHYGIRLMQHGTGGYGPPGEGFDREGCEADCRDQFGIWPDAWGGPTLPGYEAYAQCIQGCDNRFWKDFDRRMRRLEKEK